MAVSLHLFFTAIVALLHPPLESKQVLHRSPVQPDGGGGGLLGGQRQNRRAEVAQQPLLQSAVGDFVLNGALADQTEYLEVGPGLSRQQSWPPTGDEALAKDESGAPV